MELPVNAGRSRRHTFGRIKIHLYDKLREIPIHEIEVEVDYRYACTNHQPSNNAIKHEILLQVSAGYNCNPYTINILLNFKLHNLRGIWSINVCSLKHNINIHQIKIEFRLMNTEVNILTFLLVFTGNHYYAIQGAEVLLLLSCAYTSFCVSRTTLMLTRIQPPGD